MLLKSFINDKELIELLNWFDNINLKQEANGKNVYINIINEFPNIPKCINDIRKKCLDITGKAFQEPLYKDFVMKITLDGYVNLHTDPSRDGYKHLRFNVLLQKPELNGNIIYKDENINMEAKDCFVIDSSLFHGISKVDGNKSYKSIVFGFLVKDN
jgi:hypothetical protein